MTGTDWLLNLCVPTLRVADVSFNTAQILQILKDSSSSSGRKQLCLFPQLALSGSTCGDLFFQSLLTQASLQALAIIENAIVNTDLSVVIGLPLLLENQLYDAVAVIEPQGLRGFVLNQEPEPRYFQVPHENTPSNINWKGRSIEIFEQGRLDLPSLGVEQVQILIGKLPDERLPADEKLILNPTALPALADSTNDLVFQGFSNQNKGLLAICSAGAAESTGEEVFSGLCQVWQNGKLLAEDSELSFESKVMQIDTQSQLTEQPLSKNNQRNPMLPFLLIKDQDKQLETAFEIQTTGLMGRMRHTKSEKLVLGISGGADSSIAFFICCHALEQLGLPIENLIAVSMPGPGSSVNSQKNTVDLTNLAGIKQRVISITAVTSEHLMTIGHDGTADVTYENAQARERTKILMNLANLQKGLVIGTGDLSEIALGWSTYNGDQMSMYNVNAGLPKTILLRLLPWAAELLFGVEGRNVAQRIVEAPISPELQPLAPDGSLRQATEDVLGPYLLHDFFLWHAIQERKTPDLIFAEANQVFAGDYEPSYILKTLQTFYQRFFRHQFKRTAAPDGPRIFSLNLSARTGWRMPADASPSLWLHQLDQIQKTIQTGKNVQ